MNYILIFILLLIAELVYFWLANRFSIIALPNKRSSSSQVTLRGGGIIFYIAILFYFLFQEFSYPFFFIGLTLISIVSFIDDIRSLSVKLRLLVHFTAMGLMFYQWGLFELPWYFSVCALVVSTGILNAYNFMDGINGITGGYSLVVAAALLYINIYRVQFIDNELIYYVILSLLVFNYFNFRTKARCFAGDVGSISIAFILLFLLGKLIIATNDISYIVLLGVYGVDTVLTIIRRLLLKENIFEAHRKHVYQLLANEIKLPHVWVSTIYASLQALIIVGFLLLEPYSYWYPCVVVAVLAIGWYAVVRYQVSVNSKQSTVNSKE
ncbi:MAG: glycosyltransferase family 4 protein [Paludibacter sp.]|nr:glycosyltransferase family 4 protein [Paludibacter sp.]